MTHRLRSYGWVNLGAILATRAAESPRSPALLLDDASVAYAELADRAAGAVAELRSRGVAAGDRVALQLPNGPAFVATLFAIWSLGAVAVPLNVLLAPPEVESWLDLSGASLLVDDESFDVAAHASLAPVERTGADPAAILFTSGTVGTPKGAVLTHGSLWAAARAAADAMALGSNDVVLGAAPFSHVLGLSTGVVGTLASGAAVAVERRFDGAKTLARMTRTRTTIMLGVPSMCIALCEAARSARALPPIRLAHVGGAPVPNEVADSFEHIFGTDLVEGYGLTEMSGIATTFGPGERRRPGSVGRPVDGTELRIAASDGGGVGEVQFRGPSIFAGYWQDPVATAEAISADGWLATGDVGRLDGDGYLYLVDRKKEVVIRGGYNVYPREVEEALYAHPDVLEAAVIGVPHDTLGEEVAAVVALRPGSTLDTESLTVWTKQRVAAYKYPRVIVFVDDLPKGATGKILKRAIDRDLLQGGG